MTRKEWKRYARDLEAYARGRFSSVAHRCVEPPAKVIEVEVKTKWIAKLILDFRKSYVRNCSRPPTHVYLPPEYLETLLLELPPGTLDSSPHWTTTEGCRVFGMKIISKDHPARRPFDMWEHHADA